MLLLFLPRCQCILIYLSLNLANVVNCTAPSTCYYLIPLTPPKRSSSLHPVPRRTRPPRPSRLRPVARRQLRHGQHGLAPHLRVGVPQPRGRGLERRWRDRRGSSVRREPEAPGSKARSYYSRMEKNQDHQSCSVSVFFFLDSV